MTEVFDFIFKFIYNVFVETSLWSDVVFIIPKAVPAWKDKYTGNRFFIISNIIIC